jgi:hypothetical protein
LRAWGRPLEPCPQPFLLEVFFKDLSKKLIYAQASLDLRPFVYVFCVSWDDRHAPLNKLFTG